MAISESDNSTSNKPKAHEPGWLMGDIVDPFVNGLAIDSWNAVASSVDAIAGHKLLGEHAMLAESSNKFGHGGWLAQTVFGSVGSLVPYVAVGEATGGVLRFGGRALESSDLIASGSWLAKGLANERAATILGAGLYGGAREPEKGESRVLNAVGSMAAFSAFELGNKFAGDLPASKNVWLRGATSIGVSGAAGVVGGASQFAISDHKELGKPGSTDALIKAGIAGGVMNLALPAVQDGVVRGAELMKIPSAIREHFGMGGNNDRAIPVRRFVARQGWSDNPKLKALVDQSPLTRVRLVDSGATRINQKSNIVELSPEAAAPKDLGHELDHRITLRETKAKLNDAAKLADPTSPEFDPVAAKAAYVNIKTASEASANAAENRVARAGGEAQTASTRFASPATGSINHGEMFDREGDRFVNTGGAFRPQFDYSGGGVRSDGKLATIDVSQIAPGQELYPNEYVHFRRRPDGTLFARGRSQSDGIWTRVRTNETVAVTPSEHLYYGAQPIEESTLAHWRNLEPGNGFRYSEHLQLGRNSRGQYVVHDSGSASGLYVRNEAGRYIQLEPTNTFVHLGPHGLVELRQYPATPAVARPIAPVAQVAPIAPVAQIAPVAPTTPETPSLAPEIQPLKNLGYGRLANDRRFWDGAYGDYVLGPAVGLIDGRFIGRYPLYAEANDAAGSAGFIRNIFQRRLQLNPDDQATRPAAKISVKPVNTSDGRTYFAPVVKIQNPNGEWDGGRVFLDDDLKPAGVDRGFGPWVISER